MTKRTHEILETILQKPESTRKKIAFVAVVCIMTFIVGVWWMTFSIQPIGVVTDNANTVVVSPFEITWHSLKNTLKLNPIFK